MSAPSIPLHIETALEGRDARLTLVGELTLSTVPLFTAQVTDVLGFLRPHLTLDMGRLYFCDSVGLSALIGTQRRAALIGGGVVLSGVHGSLARTLAVTGAAMLFDVDGPIERAGTPAPNGSGCAGEPA